MTAFLLVAILPVSVRLIDKPVNRKFLVNRLTVNIPSKDATASAVNTAHRANREADMSAVVTSGAGADVRGGQMSGHGRRQRGIATDGDAVQYIGRG